MDGNPDDGGNNARKRKNRTSMDLTEIWKLYNDSVEINGLSLSMLVRSKQNDRQAGCSSTTSTHWMKKCMTMYLDRAKHGFKGVKDVNVVCDASRHSVYDCLVSVFYTRQNDIAAYPPTQSLRSTKFVRPGEIACDSQVEKLLAEGSRTRLAGYRLLQAISHQLTLICDGLDLTSFMVPEAMAAVLKPLSSSVTRVVRGSSVRLVDTANAAPSPTINLLDLCKLPILVLGIFGLFISFCFFLSLSTYLTHIYIWYKRLQRFFFGWPMVNSLSNSQEWIKGLQAVQLLLFSMMLQWRCAISTGMVFTDWSETWSLQSPAVPRHPKNSCNREHCVGLMYTTSTTNLFKKLGSMKTRRTSWTASCRLRRRTSIALKEFVFQMILNRVM